MGAFSLRDFSVYANIHDRCGVNLAECSTPCSIHILYTVVLNSVVIYVLDRHGVNLAAVITHGNFLSFHCRYSSPDKKILPIHRIFCLPTSFKVAPNKIIIIKEKRHKNGLYEGSLKLCACANFQTAPTPIISWEWII